TPDSRQLRRLPGSAARALSRDEARARIRHEAARVDDRLARLRQRVDLERAVRSEVENAPVLEDDIVSFVRLERGSQDDLEPEVDRVLQKDAREAPRDDRELESLETRGRLLARGAAAEVPSGSDDRSGRDGPGVQRRPEGRMVGEGVRGRLTRKHRGHVAPGVDDVRRDVVAELQDDAWHLSAPFAGR